MTTILAFNAAWLITNLNTLLVSWLAVGFCCGIGMSAYMFFTWGIRLMWIDAMFITLCTVFGYLTFLIFISLYTLSVYFARKSIRDRNEFRRKTGRY